eukprot:scaffold245548_cov24-Attheya_sp.AAC.1
MAGSGWVRLEVPDGATAVPRYMAPEQGWAAHVPYLSYQWVLHELQEGRRPQGTDGGGTDI